MRIYFDNVNFSSQSGPNSFAYRLADQFVKLGSNEIVIDPKQTYDVFLAFIEPTHKPREGTKTIQRLDGFWMAPNEFNSGKNKNIINCYRNFNKVIWQSEFDRKMTEKWFGKKKNGYVIHNGIDLKKHKPYNLPKNFSDQGNFPKNHTYFACSANWHGQKRLIENIKLFKIIRKQLRSRDVDSTLLVLGNTSAVNPDDILKVWPHGSPERIAWLGNVSHQQCLETYSAVAESGGYFIHLAFLDHCPNVCIEALSQGCPVICTDSGGTHEIVKNNGIIIKENNPHNLELVEYDKPYEINLNGFNLPKRSPKVNVNYLDIESVARRYLGVMR